ncbi:MAG: PQQ-binding-like beta-propeller repeat protein [Bacteroidales bacterium]|nr:PQQ-binding-like beta-propeller repeat protein [Bacteroidales bacterium]
MRRFTLFLLTFALMTIFATALDAKSPPTTSPNPATVVRGRVYDQNGMGLKGVVVSDGFSLVKTGSDGGFAIEKRKESKFVFVSTPDGYEHVGDFYQKADSQNLIFPLVKVKNQSSRFIHTGDTEEAVYKDWMDIFKDYIANNKPSFVLFNGDICYEPGMRLHAKHFTKEKLGVRVVYTVGNHDLVDGDYGEQLFEDLFGPAWYSFNLGGVHFVSLPVIQGDRKTGYTQDILFDWLRRDLDLLPKGTPVVIFNHHLWGFADKFNLKTPNQQLDLLQYNLKGYLHAHYHTNLYHKTPEGVAVIATMSPNKGGKDHSPSSFRIVDFDRDGNLTTTLKYSPIRRHIAANALPVQGDSIKVVASVYDTSAETERITVNGVSLTRESNFNWSGFIKKGDNENDLILKSLFSNGSVIYTPLHLHNNQASPKVAWVTNLRGNIMMTSPLIAGDLVLTAVIDDEMAIDAAIYALNRFSGEIVWRVSTNNSVKNNMFLYNGIVYAADVEGIVYAFEVETGQLKWSKPLKSNAIQYGYNQGVVVSNGVLFAGQGYYLTALDAESGEILWVNTHWRGDVATVASPIVDQENGVLLTAAYWTGRFAHNVKSGELLWEKKDSDTRYCDNSPVLFNGRFFYASPSYITEVEPVSGEELLKHKIDYRINSNSRPFVTDKYYVTGTTDKGVVAFDRTDNYKELWNFKTNPALLYTAPYTKDFQMTVDGGVAVQLADDNNGRVYFGANDGFVYCVDLRTGRFIWRLNVGTPVLSNLIIDNDILYISDFGGNIWAINL